MAVKTINNRLAVLSTLIKYSTGEKSKLRFKVAGMSAQIESVSPEDVERLVKAATDQRYRVLVLLAAEAGLRTGEIRGLQWTDLKDGQLTVRRALDYATFEVIAPKHNKSRIVPLSPRIVEALAALPRRGLWVVGTLAGGPLSYAGVLEAVNEIYDRAKVGTRPETDPLSPAHLRDGDGEEGAARCSSEAHGPRRHWRRP